MSTSKTAAVQKILTAATLNPNVLHAQYAVRGEILIRAQEYAAKLRSGEKSGLPFDEMVYCNIGNPHELGQQPITFFHQVLACVDYPPLASLPSSATGIPTDAAARAQKYLAAIGGGMGAYSHSQGLPIVREEIARFITARDGTTVPSRADDIFITDGASPAVQNGLKLLIRDGSDGVLVPIPQYPLYSATLAMLGGKQVNYPLDEESGWSLSVADIDASVRQARAKGINCRALVVINPGNPTGQCLPRQNIADILRYCARERLVVLADEVYQENIYDSSVQFHSFRKVLFTDLAAAEREKIELLSFHSISKGFVGECGRRGGYVEAINIADDVIAQLYKLASVTLCPNTTGQLLMGLKVQPPRPGEPSYALYQSETTAILASLGRRARKLTAALNKLPGVKCNEAKASMYAFPQISLSAAACAAAAKAGKVPDVFYALECLRETGIVVVAGSGFGQKDGTFHFRTTFLPSEEKIDMVITRFSKFHTDFMNKYKSPSASL